MWFSQHTRQSWLSHVVVIGTRGGTKLISRRESIRIIGVGPGFAIATRRRRRLPRLYSSVWHALPMHPVSPTPWEARPIPGAQLRPGSRSAMRSDRADCAGPRSDGSSWRRSRRLWDTSPAASSWSVAASATRTQRPRRSIERSACSRSSVTSVTVIQPPAVRNTTFCPKPSTLICSAGPVARLGSWMRPPRHRSSDRSSDGLDSEPTWVI